MLKQIRLLTKNLLQGGVHWCIITDNSDVIHWVVHLPKQTSKAFQAVFLPVRPSPSLPVHHFCFGDARNHVDISFSSSWHGNTATGSFLWPPLWATQKNIAVGFIYVNYFHRNVRQRTLRITVPTYCNLFYLFSFELGWGKLSVNWENLGAYLVCMVVVEISIPKSFLASHMQSSGEYNWQFQQLSSPQLWVPHLSLFFSTWELLRYFPFLVPAFTPGQLRISSQLLAS